MMTNIVDCDLDNIRIGQPVRLVFKPSDGGPPVPMFAPVYGIFTRPSRCWASGRLPARGEKGSR